MTRFLLLAAAVLILTPLGSAISAPAISPEVSRLLGGARAGERVPVIVTFRESTDLASFGGIRANAGNLIIALRATSSRSQARVMEMLRTTGYPYTARSFWINNSLAIPVDRPLLETLTRFDEIERIDYDEPVTMPEPKPVSSETRLAEWNLVKVGVPEIWSSLGLAGTGIVIGSMDTGIDITHPALAGKWRGGSNSWIDIINGLPDPYDDHGHGTHTIGTLVGGDGPGPFGDDIGVAYNAQVISAKVLDENNSFSSASIVVAGAQWMLDPDDNPTTDDFPHVISNSWYFFSQTYTGYHSTVAAWRAAGIIPVFCIGNEGPAAGSTRPPANYNNAIGVGATDAGDAIAFFSSRGPSPIGASFFPADQRKPEISAPGVAVRSSLPGGLYEAWSGTSMATPLVAATAALMIQGRPTLTFDEIRGILLATAVDLGTPGYDHAYGYGRLDALAAVGEAVAGAEVPPPNGGISLAASPNPFDGAIRLDYSLPRGGDGGTRLEIFDATGRMIRSFYPGATTGSIDWNGRDPEGRGLPSGIYFIRLSDGRVVEARGVVRLKR